MPRCRFRRSPSTAATKRVDPPILGFVIGAAIPALVASAAWWLGVPWIAFVAAVGIPIGALFAAIVAPRMVGPDWVGATLLAALAAPLVPGALIALGLLAGSIATAFGIGRGRHPRRRLLRAASPSSSPSSAAPRSRCPSPSWSRCWSGEPSACPGAGPWATSARWSSVTVVVGLVTIAAATGLLAPYGIGRVDTGY